MLVPYAISVKYGETLRRFTTYVSYTMHLMGPDPYFREPNMNMDALKAKIVSLFNFDSDAELNITYKDEDEHVVTLVNDEDLADAIRQRINPLRLEVIVMNPRISQPITPSERSTPLRSPRMLRDPSTVITSGLEEAFKSLPEPISAAISDLSQHLAAKATESAPVIREIIEQIAKIAQNAQSNPVSSSRIRDGSEAAGVSPSQIAGRVTSSQVKAAPVSTPIRVIPPLQSVPPSESNPVLDSGVGSLMDLDLGLKSAPPVAPPASVLFNSPDCAGPCKNGRGQREVRTVPIGPSASYCPPHAGTVLIGPSASYCQPHAGDPLPVYPSPFAGNKLETTEMQTPWPFAPVGPQLVHGWDSTSQCFHRGVTCDGCGMHPIVGPRYQSEVKDDYDLCGVCFARMGNEADYTRMDRAVYRPPHTLRDTYKHHPHFVGHHGRIPGPKRCKLKLESRFIKDVTVLDGTIVAPNTPFTKIWRMRNSGTLPWPAHSQLIWIGGDQMGNATSVDLYISENGLPVDEELEIAVDFVSPPQPGRYTSYWRMSSPTGQKFGPRVCVLIQVETFPPDGVSHPQVSFSPLNLNLLPQCTSYKQKGVELMDLGIRAPPSAIKVVQPPSGDNSDTAPVLNFCSPHSAPSLPLPTVHVSVEGPVKAFSGNDGPPVDVSVGISVVAPISTNGELQNMEQTTKEAEETLLKELAKMGFKQIQMQ